MNEMVSGTFAIWKQSQLASTYAPEPPQKKGKKGRKAQLKTLTGAGKGEVERLLTMLAGFQGEGLGNERRKGLALNVAKSK